MHRHRCRNEKALVYAKAINKNLQIIMRLNPNLHQGQR